MVQFDPGFKRNRASIQVYTRARWSDPWVQRSNLVPRHLSWMLGAINEAQLRYHFGNMVLPGESTYQAVARSTYDNHWVKIRYLSEVEENSHVTPPEASYTKWYGLVTASHLDPRAGSGAISSGDQFLIAHGPEIALTRVQMVDSIIYKTNALASSGYSPIRFGRGMPFNAVRDAGRNGVSFGNKTTQAASLFAEDPLFAQPWNAYEIIFYVLDQVVNPSIPVGGPTWTLQSFDDGLLAYTPHHIETHGRTAWEIINQVIDRRRGLSWYVEPVLSGDTVTGWRIRVVPLNSSNIYLSDTEVLNANPNRVNLSIINAKDVANCTLTQDGLNRYRQVVVEGGQQGAVFSLDFDYGLEIDWTQDDELAYQEAATQDINPAVTYDHSQLCTMHDSRRMSSQLSHVFSRMRVRSDWAGYARGDGSTTFGGLCFPKVGADYNQIHDELSIGHPVTPRWMRIEPRLPLRLNSILATTVAADVAVAAMTLQPHSPPMAYGSDTAWAATQPSRYLWLHADQAAGALDEATKVNGSQVSCAIEVLDDDFGFQLHSNGPSHVLQNYHTYDGSSGPAPSHVEVGTVNASSIGITCYARANHCVRVAYPETMTSLRTDQSEVHYIRLGDRARYDLLVEGTVVDIAAGELIRVPSSIPIRDDLEFMGNVGRLAWEWYRKPRHSLTLSYRQVLDHAELPIGTMITKFSSTSSAGATVVLQTLAGVDIETLTGVDITLLASEDVFAGDDPPLQTITGVTISTLGDDAVTSLSTPIDTVVSEFFVDFDSGVTRITTQFAEIDFEGLFA